jgi:hypothetical protein
MLACQYDSNRPTYFVTPLQENLLGFQLIFHLHTPRMHSKLHYGFFIPEFFLKSFTLGKELFLRILLGFQASGYHP